MADSTLITALAAIGGSIVGGVSSFATTYVTQRHQGRRERVARELERREALYGQFIEKAAGLFVDSLDKSLGNPTVLVDIGAVAARIRLSAGTDVIAASDVVMRAILEGYGRPPTAAHEFFAQTRDAFTDPLLRFTDACRSEREAMLRGF